MRQKFILIDDDAGALDLMMQALAPQAESITAVWANTSIDIETTNIADLSPFCQAVPDVRFGCRRHVRSQAELAAVIQSYSDEPSRYVLCSDLTMREGSGGSDSKSRPMDG